LLSKIFLLLLFTIGSSLASAQDVYLIDSIKTVDVLKNAIIYPDHNKTDFNHFKAALPELTNQKNLDKTTENWMIFTVHHQNIKGHLYFFKTNFADSIQLYDFESGQLIGKTGYGYQIGEISRNIKSGFIPIYFFS